MSLDNNDIQNKMMQAAPSKKEFHFAGGGIWRNATILAETIEEAEKLWHATKQLIAVPQIQISSEQSTPAPQQPPEETTVQ